MEEKRKNKINIDFFQLLKILKEDRKNLLIIFIVTFVIGVVVAFSIPRIYKTQVKLAPETSGSSMASGGISSLASMVGINMDAGMMSDAIYPEIYPDLMRSTNFIVSLFNINVHSKDGKINTTYYNYVNSCQKVPWWSYPQIWISNLFKSKSVKKKTGKVNPFELTMDEFGVAQSISNDIVCNVDKKTSVISIEVTAQDPLISASLADSVKNRLQVYITNYRTNKARTDLAYMQRLFEDSKRDYAKARQTYAAFSDANQNLILESYKSKQEDLENEMQLQYNIYTQVAQQLQMAKAKVQERTPAFTTLQSATVPIKHSNTPKIYILFVFLSLSFGVRLCILLYKNIGILIKYN